MNPRFGMNEWVGEVWGDRWCCNMDWAVRGTCKLVVEKDFV